MQPERRWERWGPLSGVVFVVLVVLGFVVAGSSPDDNDPGAKITAYLSKNSHQSRNIIAFFLLLAAILFLLAFFAALRSRLVDAEGGLGRLGALAFGAGVASTVLLFTAISLFISPVLLADDLPRSIPNDPSVYRITQVAGYELWVGSTVLGALVAWATAAVVLRTRLLPKWFAWFSILVGVVCLAAVFFIPIFVFWLWIVVTAILLVLRRAPVAASAPRAEPVTGI
jgi:hypothetical protein